MQQFYLFLLYLFTSLHFTRCTAINALHSLEPIFDIFPKCSINLIFLSQYDLDVKIIAPTTNFWWTNFKEYKLLNISYLGYDFLQTTLNEKGRKAAEFFAQQAVRRDSRSFCNVYHVFKNSFTSKTLETLCEALRHDLFHSHLFIFYERVYFPKLEFDDGCHPKRVSFWISMIPVSEKLNKSVRVHGVELHPLEISFSCTFCSSKNEQKNTLTIFGKFQYAPKCLIMFTCVNDILYDGTNISTLITNLRSIVQSYEYSVRNIN